MSSEEQRARRAAVRRETWLVEPLDGEDNSSSLPVRERLERLERLRQLAFTLARIDYPEQPTPREQRQHWPLERIP